MKKRQQINTLISIIASSITSAGSKTPPREEMRAEYRLSDDATLIVTNYREASPAKVGELHSRPRKLDGRIRMAIVVTTNSNVEAGEYLHVSGASVCDVFDMPDELDHLSEMLIDLDLRRTTFQPRYSEDGMTRLVDGRNTLYLKLK